MGQNRSRAGAGGTEPAEVAFAADERASLTSKGEPAQVAEPTSGFWVVYYGPDDHRCIGHIIPRGKSGFEAFSPADRSLGLFPDLTSAVGALSDDWGRP